MDSLKRIIAHIDMDAFFAALEEREHPWMQGKPVAVGSDPMEGKGRGVVSTANYKAREYGIKSATPISKAWKLSEDGRRQGKPAVIFVQPDFSLYSRCSENIMLILRRYSRSIEQASIDEAYLDLSYAGSFEEAEKIAQEIKDEIKQKEKVTASIGIGPNKLIAKIASDFRKPDGFTVVPSSEAERFLQDMSVRKIPGIGPKTEILLGNNGIFKIRDLKKFSRNELREMLGVFGEAVYDKCRGVDESEVVEEYEVKSIGEQTTLDQDTLDSRILIEQIEELCSDVWRRLKKSEFDKFRTVILTVRFSDFTTKSRSATLKDPQDNLKTLKFTALKLFFPFLSDAENPGRKKIRLLGVRIEKLSN